MELRGLFQWNAGNSSYRFRSMLKYRCWMAGVRERVRRNAEISINQSIPKWRPVEVHFVPRVQLKSNCNWKVQRAKRQFRGHRFSCRSAAMPTSLLHHAIDVAVVVPMEWRWNGDGMALEWRWNGAGTPVSSDHSIIYTRTKRAFCKPRKKVRVVRSLKMARNNVSRHEGTALANLHEILSRTRCPNATL